MSSTKRLSVGAASVVTLIACAQWVPATAQAAEELHNVTYLARVTGVARGAEITYKINDTQVDSANPTMIPGRTFEADAVLADPKQAGMQVSIQWPYSASLHCEIQVDGETVAEARPQPGRGHLELSEAGGTRQRVLPRPGGVVDPRDPCA